MTIHVGNFPFEEFKHEDGNLFESWSDAKIAGYDNNQIWSVAEGDDDDVWTYGPPHHWINVIGYVATKERHDHNTYYEERF